MNEKRLRTYDSKVSGKLSQYETVLCAGHHFSRDKGIGWFVILTGRTSTERTGVVDGDHRNIGSALK